MPALVSTWYLRAILGEGCSPNTRCKNVELSGICDFCDTVDGRSMEAVNEYASTCDWCGELTMHESMRMDPKTQLGYCPDCIPKLPKAILEGLEKELSAD
ncbi:MAG TPA: hypothetical protein VJJ72_02325 [Candidatus Paceibacterota bacterium]